MGIGGLAIFEAACEFLLSTHLLLPSRFFPSPPRCFDFRYMSQCRKARSYVNPELVVLMDRRIMNQVIYIGNSLITLSKYLNSISRVHRIKPHRPRTTTITTLHNLRSRDSFSRYDIKDGNLHTIIARYNPNTSLNLPGRTEDF